jgi:short-subunit dehydrogenase
MGCALITGASSGIGFELAKLFARDKHHLILVARRKEKMIQLARELEENYQVITHVLVRDLSQSQAPEEIYKWIKKNDIRIDFLVNNAGFIVYGNFSDTRWEDELNMMKLHMETTSLLTKLFLPDMLMNKQGRILNVGSTGSFVPGPYLAVYCATKSYILSLSEALSEELYRSGVTVTVLCPGRTKTGFEINAVGKTIMNETRGMNAEKVARIAYRALMKGRRVVIPGLHNRIQVFATRFLPRAILTRFIKIMMQKYR